MHEIMAQKNIQAPLATIWALVEDFSNLDWYSPATKVEKIASNNSDRKGEIRRIHMTNMPEPVDEVLDRIDSDNHSIYYHIPGTPMANYQVCVSLTVDPDGGVNAKWHASFTEITVEGLTPEMMISMMEDTYSNMLEEISRAVQAG